MLSLRGRASRRDYIVVNLCLGIVPALVGDWLEPKIKSAIDQLPDAVGGIAMLLLLIVLLWLVWVLALALPVRRLHDMNLSGWYYLLVLFVSGVPYVGPVVAFIWLVFIPGTKGRNRFGLPDRSVVEVFDGPTSSPDTSRPKA